MHTARTSRMILNLNLSVLTISHTSEVEIVMMLTLTNVFNIMKETSSSRGLPNKSAISWLRLFELDLNRSRWREPKEKNAPSDAEIIAERNRKKAIPAKLRI